MARLMLTDELWSKLRIIMRQHGIYDKSNLRMIAEGILYRMRVGCPWRDLPSKFGFWNSIYQQFNRWSSKDKGLLTIHLMANVILSEAKDLLANFVEFARRSFASLRMTASH